MFNANLYTKYAEVAPKMTCIMGKETTLVPYLTEAQLCRIWNVSSFEEAELARIKYAIKEVKKLGERKVKITTTQYRYDAVKHQKIENDIDQIVEDLEDEGYKVNCDLDWSYDYHVRKDGVKTIYPDGRSEDWTNTMSYKITIKW